jgi:hypothetical protein
MNNECLKRFASAVSDLFEDGWLRLWTMEEALESSNYYEQLGFPWCLGAVDCASWTWEAYPIEYQGMCKGKDRKPTVRMEVTTDDFLRIHWLNFGIPGSKNDIQIVNQSPFFNRIRSGRWPPACPSLNICGYAMKTFYFLADGIYPRLRFFVTTISSPSTAKEEAFCLQQEGARKAAERVFAVLFEQFAVLCRPSRLRDIKDMINIVKCCCILHNMIQVERKDKYTRSLEVMLPSYDIPEPEGLQLVIAPEESLAAANFWRENLATVESPADHAALKTSLVEYIWAKKGQIA